MQQFTFLSLEYQCQAKFYSAQSSHCLFGFLNSWLNGLSLIALNEVVLRILRICEIIMYQ